MQQRKTSSAEGVAAAANCHLLADSSKRHSSSNKRDALTSQAGSIPCVGNSVQMSPPSPPLNGTPLRHFLHNVRISAEYYYVHRLTLFIALLMSRGERGLPNFRSRNFNTTAANNIVSVRYFKLHYLSKI
jgi:hypothetical protein